MTQGTATPAPQPSTHTLVWIGRVLSWLIAAFLAFDAIMKIMKAGPVVEGSAKLGFPPDAIVPLGCVLLASVLLYVVPQTAVLGAILLTGYLGGAVYVHVQQSEPLLTAVLFPVYFGVGIWLGLVLSDARVRAVLPFRR